MKVLVLGGSKSGKSLWAQEQCRRLADGGRLVYWAAMQPTDAEDEERIRRHRAERAGWGFETVECGAALDRQTVAADSTVLFDSVTALLSNEMFGAAFDADAAENTATELLNLSRRVKHIVCVCDDIFRDGGEYELWTERYREGLAAVCRVLAAEFDIVCELCAGQVRVWKGSL